MPEELLKRTLAASSDGVFLLLATSPLRTREGVTVKSHNRKHESGIVFQVV